MNLVFSVICESCKEELFLEEVTLTPTGVNYDCHLCGYNNVGHDYGCVDLDEEPQGLPDTE